MQAQDLLPQIPRVTISPKGIFKYILIMAKISQEGKTTQMAFVRGSDKREYHAENFQDFMVQVKGKGFIVNKKFGPAKDKFECHKDNVKIVFTVPGGGRIEHNYHGKKCFIYGYSKSYGRVDHQIAQKLVSEALGYPLAEITTSQEGY